MGRVTTELTPENVWMATCAEAFHRSNDSCNGVLKDVWLDAFKFALKMHTPMYLLPAIITHRKNPQHFIKKTIPSIIRSSIFLATLPTGTAPIQCWLRKTTGRNHPIYAFIGGLVTGFICINIEHPSRRNELVVYTVNQLVETLYKMAVVRGWAKFVPKANCFIFVMAMSLLSYQYHYQRKNLGNIRSILKFFLGDRDDHPQLALRNEEGGRGVLLGVRREGETIEEAKERRTKFFHSIRKELTIAVKSTARAFFMGIAIRGGFGFLVSMIGLLRTRLFSNAKVKKSLAGALYKICLKSFGGNTMQFSLFLFLMVGGWRFTLLALRILTGESTRLHTFISGAVSGLSMFYSPSTEIAMYFASKAAEGAFRTGVDNGYVRTVPKGDVMLFTLGCGILFYACVIEPFNLRPSYQKFLVNVSGGRALDYEPVARAFHPDWFTKTGFTYPKR
ncbi:transmembrane protein [Planoprotostelium fungivorum]|uniref:Transmembrane protein n=1 Tax=Planoprotostelium fungivorum TaxID=1890364 RepID=A0A2P6N7V9_9EUKA|nr:transmembrane protein [Planoprotostelium fungivorum]